MAEGGINEEFELQNRDQEYREEYGDLDRETLDGLYGELEEVRRGDVLYADTWQRMEYIDSIRGEAEYSFIDDVPDPKYDGRTFNSQVTRDREGFLRKHLGLDINIKDGPASDELIHKMRITFGANTK